MTTIRRGPKELRKTLTFDELWKRGWRTLIPVIPPGVKLTALSKIPESARGKVPGVRYVNGWGGLGGWQVITPTPTLYSEWERMGASIGCRCDEILALDCDIPDRELSLGLLHALQADPELGLADAAYRVGKSPKWLMPLAFPGGTGSWNLDFTKPRALDDPDPRPLTFQVQGLGKGKQFVAWGIHPATEQLYKWSHTQAPPPCNTLPLYTTERVAKLKQRIIYVLEGLGCTLAKAGSGGVVGPVGQPPDQDSLKGEPLLVREALQAIPNDLSYDDWQGVAVALRGASQDWPGAGLELFLEFTGRATRVLPDLEDARRKYESYRPPFHLGAQRLYDLAGDCGWNKAAVDFKPAPTTERLRRDKEEIHAGDVVQTVNAQATSEQAKYSDRALAYRFVERWQDKLRYVGETGRWHGWDGTCWRPDESGAALGQQLATFLCHEANRVQVEGADTAAERKAKSALHTRLHSAPLQRNVAALVRDPLTISQQLLDTDLDALNTPAGLLHLPTGEILPDRRKRLVTRVTHCAPAPAGAVPHRWLRFLDEATGGDLDLAAFLQRAVGYTLFGTLPEHKLFFVYGPGGNGKSVFLDVVAALLASYATPADRHLFLQSRYAGHPTALASLAGYRMIQVPEVDTHAQWNDALVKTMCAGGVVKARFIGKDETTFTPRGTLWFSGNSKPSFAKLDEGMVRRILILPFDQTPAKPDLHLTQHLIEHEGPAILRWMLDGARVWHVAGLGTPRRVIEETESYFADNDPFRAWLRDCCRLGPGERLTTADAVRSYHGWCRSSANPDPMAEVLSEMKLVARLLQVPGVHKWRSNTAKGVTGLGLKLQVVGGTESSA